MRKILFYTQNHDLISPTCFAPVISHNFFKLQSFLFNCHFLGCYFYYLAFIYFERVICFVSFLLGTGLYHCCHFSLTVVFVWFSISKHIELSGQNDSSTCNASTSSTKYGMVTVILATGKVFPLGRLPTFDCIWLGSVVRASGVPLPHRSLALLTSINNSPA